MTDDILDGVNRKDMKAWEKLYAIYYAALCSYAENVLKDPDVAQDVVQDVLVKIWTSSQQFATVPELTAYLYRAVYNNSMCYLRTRQIRSRNFLTSTSPVLWKRKCSVPFICTLTSCLMTARKLWNSL